MVQTNKINLIGRTLGDFELRERVSTGGMGTVYKAHQRGMQRTVALKVLPAELAANPVALQRFYQEARAAARLDHPNIVRAIAVGEQDGLHYFAMEYVEGESLARRIKRAGRLAEPEAVRVVAAVAEALDAAHRQGLIHRDVKPENVLLTADGQVKLADFGLVKRLDQDLGLTDAGKGLGTLNYMAPEQFKNAKHADARCDIYALGVMLYTSLTGNVPWPGLEPLAMYKRKMNEPLPSVREINAEVSERVERVIQRATQTQPQRRYANCADFLADLEGRPVADASLAEVDATRDQVDLAEPKARTAGPADVWFVRDRDQSGRTKQIRLTSEEVRQAFKSGRLAKTSRLARSDRGPWLHVTAFPEFVDCVAQLSHGGKQAEMKTDIERTVAALHAGAPLRRRDRNWTSLVVAIVFLILAMAAALWLLNR